MGKPKIAEKKKGKPIRPDIPVDIFDFKSIGTLTSVFRERFGTPKQSGYVKNAKGQLTLNKEINVSALEGLEESKFIWVIYVFNEQTPKDTDESKVQGLAH